MLAGPTELVAWHTLKAERVADLRDQLVAGGVAPSTIYVTLSALRGIVQAACDVSLVSALAPARLRWTRGPPVRRERFPLGRVLSGAEVSALFAVCWQDRSIAGVRDSAIIHGLYWAGLSNAELVALAIEDYTPLPATLQVRAMRPSRRRQVALNGDTADAFTRWRAVRGPQPGGLFLRLGRAGQFVGTNTSSVAITRVLQRRGQQVGLGLLSAEELRRTAIHDLLEVGWRLQDVQRRFGFIGLDALARYDHREPTDPRWWRAWLDDPIDPSPPSSRR